MSSYLYSTKNPIDYFIISLDMCTKTKWFLDVAMQLQSPDSKKQRLFDQKIISAFFDTINRNQACVKAFNIQKWEKIKITLTRFIDHSSDIDDSEKPTLRGFVLHGIQQYTDALDPLTKTKRLVQQATGTKPLPIDDLRYLEAAVERLAAERISCNYMILHLLADFHKYVIGEIFEQQGGAVKLCDKRLYSIDWEQCTKQSAEDFAMSAKLEEAHNEAKGDYFPLLKKLIRTTNPVAPILEIWRSFYAVYQLDLFNTFFIEALAKLRGPISTVARDPNTPFLSIEVKELYLEIQAMSENPSYRNTLQQSKKKLLVKQYLEKQLLTATKYFLQTDSINNFYKTLYNTVEEQKKKHKGYSPGEVTRLVGEKLPTPDEFAALALPPISLDSFEKTVQQDFPRYSSVLTEEDEAFSAITFMEYLYGKDNANSFSTECLRRFCKYYGFNKHFTKKKESKPIVTSVEVVTEEFSHLSFTKKRAITAVKKVKPKRIFRSEPSPQTTSHTLIPHTPPSPAIEKKQVSIKHVRKLTIQKRSILASARVRDWHRDVPIALTHPPYLQLSTDKKADAKFFHSYPFLVTQILLDHVEPEIYESPTTKKPNKLYSRPGTIYRYETDEAPFQGYFADCFDEFELYHHFFHQQKFSDLMKRYASHSSLVNNGERHDIANEAKRLEKIVTGDSTELAAGELDERFLVKRKRYSIDIDDTAQKILYTICFPEWVSNS
jgi:hypothetical protein